jgi:peptidoglycan-associated lipoprotein
MTAASTSRPLRLALVGLGAVAVLASVACTKRPVAAGTTAEAGAVPAYAPVAPTPPTGPMNAVRPGSEQDFSVNVGDRVYFDLDSHTLRADSLPRLADQARWLQQYPRITVRIEGNADERGTREYNLALGARRAQSVRAYLVSQGVAAGRIDVISYGKERPIAQGAGEAAHAQNRNGHTAIISGAE